jgi:hypothetical protein
MGCKKMLYLVFFIMAALLMVSLMFVKINILIEYNRKGKDDNLILSFFALSGLLKYKYEAPTVDFRKKGARFNWLSEIGGKEKDSKRITSFLDISDLFRRFEVLRKAFERYVKKRLLVKDFKLHINLGTGDAFYTGIASGSVWALAGMITAFICNNFDVEKKTIIVKPHFSEKIFEIDLFCIFNLRIVNIISIIGKASADYFSGRFGLKKLIGGGLSG